jgi:hypothetical protein
VVTLGISVTVEAGVVVSVVVEVDAEELAQAWVTNKTKTTNIKVIA